MRAMVIQSDFTGGELDPKLYGRVSIPRYQSGLTTAKNVDIMVTGGATRRAGTKFVYNAGASPLTCRQLPFVIFRSDTTPASLKGYVVEFRSDNKIRFYVDGAVIVTAPDTPYELTSPFTDADLTLLKYEQFNSGLYLVHPGFLPQLLTRTSDTSWTIVSLPFSAWAERANPKNAWIYSVCWSGTQFLAVGGADGVDAYIITSPDGITWTERVNPKNFPLFSVVWSGTQFVAVGSADGVDAYIVTSPDGVTWTEQANPKNVLLNSVVWSGTKFVAVGNADGVDAYILTSPDGVTWTEQANPKNIVLFSVVWSGTKFVAVGNADGVDAYIITSPDGITWTEQVNPKNFSLRSVVWSGTQFVAAGGVDGGDAYILTYADAPWGYAEYPAALAFFEQRLLLARTSSKPHTLWGSQTGNIMNFYLGVLDSSPFEFIPAAAAASINQIIATSQVIILTNDKEITMSGGSGLPLTPTNVQIKVVGRYGSKDGIRPLQIGDEMVFVTRSGKRIRAMAYKLVQDSYNFPNICIMSEHLLDSGIVDMQYVSEPNSCIYILLSNGRLARIAYDREQEVVAFSWYETDGLFKGICVVPEGITDKVYVTVQRVIDGTTNLYTELFDPTLNTDSAVSGTDVPGKTTWTGLDHLEGEAVDVVADGTALTATVASGQIELAAAAHAVEVGLHYESEIYDLKPEVPQADGTAQGRTSFSVNEIIVRLSGSRGCTINGQTLPAPSAVFSGDMKVSALGWGGTAGQVNIKQTKPLPFTVLGIMKRLTVND